MRSGAAMTPVLRRCCRQPAIYKVIPTFHHAFFRCHHSIFADNDPLVSLYSQLGQNTEELSMEHVNDQEPASQEANLDFEIEAEVATCDDYGPRQDVGH